MLDSAPGLKPEQVIKLSCVDVQRQASNLMQISLTPFSSCLLLPPHFRDSLAFRKTEDKNGRSPSTNFLAEFLCPPLPSDQRKFVSTVRLNFASLCHTSVADLLRVLAAPSNAVGQHFLVDAHITGFLTLEPASIFKRLLVPSNRVIEVSEEVPPGTHSRIVVSLIALLRDESITDNRHLQIYFFTDEPNELMFEAWKLLPSLTDAAAWNDLRQPVFIEFVKKVSELRQPQYVVKMVLQLIATKTKKFCFKVVDTVFLDF